MTPATCTALPSWVGLMGKARYSN